MNDGRNFRIDIPAGLTEMLRDFTVAVLQRRPTDLLQFAVEYFGNELQERRRIERPVPMYVIVDEDQEAAEPDPSDFQPINRKNHYARRHSVSAERYDPEADDDADEVRVIHPKSDEKRRRLIDAVQEILIFRCLDAEQMGDVIDAMFERRVAPDEHVITQGDDGDNFYVIESGTYDVLVTPPGGSTPSKIHQFAERGSFGELALMYNMPRSATVVALNGGTLWAMDRVSFRRIILKSAFKKRKMYELLLQSLPMLDALEPYERMNLADALSSRTFPAGACIIRQGDDAEGMYFVERGRVRVTLSCDGGITEEEVVSDAPTTYFGEMALVENQPRSASVYAADDDGDDVRVAFLERDSFERLLGPCLDIMKRNMETYQKST